MDNSGFYLVPPTPLPSTSTKTTRRGDLRAVTVATVVPVREVG
ncbi:MAG: hypothetical protein AVDCRST_MAG78-1920 [uncultured Rubrobacteraceae bacterium]|uniref:Uncharacterized protein n=1 Tax=uncultured Rubrobacteraceae bacterium TaxID=349277 RepID=A0A6J4Q9M0_9ACTN|nr:MAG: hypothetical protein AVDCRST_MAG78-1920 [uncultured Rubrobacteraceae bacterium]